MKNFTENTRVQVPAALHLCKLGYTYLDDLTSYNPQTNILTDIFIRSVKRLNPALTDLECSQLLDKIVGILNNDDLGKEFYTMLSSNSGVKLIDFADANNNEWHVTTEFTCENVESGDSFRPDITCFINGLPLAVTVLATCFSGSFLVVGFFIIADHLLFCSLNLQAVTDDRFWKQENRSSFWK